MTTPEQRRRLAAGLMAAQYDKATPQDTTVVERAGLLPIGTYANGMTGLAFPGFLADPVAGFVREATNPIPYLNRSDDEKRQAVETGFDVAGAAMVGGLAAPKPAGIVGSAGGKLAGEKGAAAGAAMNALDMSEAARLQRAREMGFDTNRVLYHGTRHPGFDEFKVGPDMTSTGSKEYGRADMGVFLTPDINFAREYGKNVGAYYVKAEKPYVFDRTAELDLGQKARARQALESAKNNGYDAFFDTNKMAPEVVVFDPKNIRSVNAAFDPSNADSANLLYANGGRPGAAAGAMLQAPNDPAVNELLRQYGIDLPRRSWSNAMLPGDA